MLHEADCKKGDISRKGQYVAKGLTDAIILEKHEDEGSDSNVSRSHEN